MSNEQQSKQRVDSMGEAQNGRTKSLKSIKRDRPKRIEERHDRPLNVLGCFALIHAIRSMDSGEGSRIGTRRATAA